MHFIFEWCFKISLINYINNIILCIMPFNLVFSSMFFFEIYLNIIDLIHSFNCCI